MFEIKKQLTWSALKAGSVITIAILIIFVLVIDAGTVKRIFTPSVEFKVTCEDVQGLRKGAPVWLFGAEVGSVKEIQFDSVYGTIITLSVKKGVLPFLRSNSQAKIMTMGLLGDKYVELTPGLPGAGPITPGEVIKGTASPELRHVVEASTNAIAKTGELINRIESLISSITEGRGFISELINDPTLYRNLEKTSATLSATLERIEKSQGTLNLLIEDPSLYERSLAAVSDLEQFAKELKGGKGTIGRLAEDPQLYENLNKSAKNLDDILSRVDKGEGMAGALFRDEELVGEVKATLLEIRGLAEEMRIVLKEIKENPEKYFQFKMF